MLKSFLLLAAFFVAVVIACVAVIVWRYMRGMKRIPEEPLWKNGKPWENGEYTG